MTTSKRPRVVVVGAGFGGLWATRTLAGKPVDVTLVDCHNYHTFLPLLYQVAAAELEPEQIIYPVRSILRKIPNVNFVMAEVRGIDLAGQTIKTSDVTIAYDYLILATGSTPFYFGVPGADECALPLKNLDHGAALRNHILKSFERAASEPVPDKRRRTLTFTIVGGGATGVEFAGALAELINGPLVKDYPSLDFNEVNIILLEAANSLITAMPERLRSYALERLRSVGVDVHLNAGVSRVTGEAVYLKDGRVIPTETVVWTAGVQGDTMAQEQGLQAGRNGRVTVEPTLQVPDRPNIYVVGDLANAMEDDRPLPMVAPVAIQQGVTAAQNILRQVANRGAVPFKYRDRGTMVTIGRSSAVAFLGKRTSVGFFAWLLWLGVHLFNLIGFRNRLLVMINWAWDYFLFERAVRFIFPSEEILHERTGQCAARVKAGSSRESGQ